MIPSKSTPKIEIDQPKENKTIMKEEIKKEVKVENIEAKQPEHIEDPITTEEEEPKKLSGEWNEVLHELKQKQNTIFALVKSAKAHIGNDLITLTFEYPFHQKRMNEAKNKNTLVKAVHKHFGKNMNRTSLS